MMKFNMLKTYRTIITPSSSITSKTKHSPQLRSQGNLLIREWLSDMRIKSMCTRVRCLMRLRKLALLMWERILSWVIWFWKSCLIIESKCRSFVKGTWACPRHSRSWVMDQSSRVPSVPFRDSCLSLWSMQRSWSRVWIEVKRRSVKASWKRKRVDDGLNYH